MILAIVNSTILLSLSSLHFYWAFGGQWGFTAALPTNEEGKRVLNPKWYDSLIVGLGLLVFAVYLLIYVGLIPFQLPKWLFDYGIWVISAIFILRAIGDFKYIGVFKKVRNTKFARRDTLLYSPLCMTIAGICIILLTK